MKICITSTYHLRKFLLYFKSRNSNIHESYNRNVDKIKLIDSSYTLALKPNLRYVKITKSFAVNFRFMVPCITYQY